MIKVRKVEGSYVADVRVRLASGQVVRNRMAVEGTRAEATRWAEDREEAIRSILDAWYRDRIVKGERLTGKEIRTALRGGVAGKPAPEKLTVQTYIDRWLKEREKRNLSSYVEDVARLRDHVLPIIGAVPLDELRPSHLRAMLEQIKVKDSIRGGKLANRTIRSCFGVVRQAMNDAVVDGLISTTPAVLKHGDLPAVADKPGFDRQARFYELEEAAALIRDPRIAEYDRVSHALSFLTGLRSSEEAALRFGSIDWTAKPLPRLVAKKAWSRGKERDTTKTGVDKWIPIHPALHAALSRWQLLGWERAYGRPPKPSDYIVPAPTCAEAPRDAGFALDHLRRDLRLLGLREERRSKHDVRAWFDSYAMACGAPQEVVSLITHPSPKCAFDGYRRLATMWPAMCAAVAAIRLPEAGGSAVANGAAPVEAAVAQQVKSPGVAEA